MTGTVYALEDRALLSVSGPDARAFLDNIITGNITRLETPGDATHAGLLTPQGKILFAFYVIARADDLILDTDATLAPALTSRLGLYKLRAKVEIADITETASVGFALDAPPTVNGDHLIIADPRAPSLPHRMYRFDGGTFPKAGDGIHDARMALHIAAARPRLGVDFETGTTFIHEANWHLDGSVDFKKGCFIGQEVVSRTQHKAVVRKRFVAVTSSQDSRMSPGDDLKAGTAAIGKVGGVTADGQHALALVRLDRVAEAIEKGDPLTVGSAPIQIAETDIEDYRARASERAASS